MCIRVLLNFIVAGMFMLGAGILILFSREAQLEAPMTSILYTYVLWTGTCLGTASGLGIALIILNLGRGPTSAAAPSAR